MGVLNLKKVYFFKFFTKTLKYDKTMNKNDGL